MDGDRTTLNTLVGDASGRDLSAGMELPVPPVPVLQERSA
jgi:hypothetical protein